MNFVLQVVASQDWPEVTKYAGLVCAQAHRQELIDDLYKEWKDPARGTVTGGMIKYVLPPSPHTLFPPPSFLPFWLPPRLAWNLMA